MNSLFSSLNPAIVGAAARLEPAGIAFAATLFVIVLALSPSVVDPGWQRMFEKPAHLREIEHEVCRKSLVARIGYPIIRYVAWVLRLIGFRARTPEREGNLALAGFPAGFNCDEYCAMCLTVVAATFAASQALFRLLLPSFSGLGPLLATGYMIFHMRSWLDDRVFLNQARLARALPPLLDMIALAMEAGMDFIPALRNLVNSSLATREPLVRDFAFMLRELELGKSRAEVFEGVRNRVERGPVNTLMTAFLQADKFGTPLAGMLRIQATAMRTHRSQMAQKLANEAPVKILGPLIFIFIALMLLMFSSIIIRYFENGRQLF